MSEGTTRGQRLRRRISALVVLTAVAAAASVVSVAGPAHAAGNPGPPIPCPTDPNLVWVRANIYRALGWVAVQYTVASATPRFYVTTGRVIANDLDTPIATTFRSSRSETYRVTITTTFGTGPELTKQLQASVSASIVLERTTSIGVETGFTVPPHTRTLGEYGVEGYDVNYGVQRYWAYNHDRNKCYDYGHSDGATTAPTVIEGWRFTSTPI